MESIATAQDRVSRILDRLIDQSVEEYHNPYLEFDWPDEIPRDRYWMSPELLSVAGTPFAEALDERQLVRLSQFESLSFHGSNVHGIRDLLLAVVERIYQPEFAPFSEYFSHFVGEENQHMWFFAQVCQRYGGKLYRQPSLPFAPPSEPEVESFLTFTRILVFEEIGHFYNLRLARDERLPPIIRQVNRVHYADEARHIAMGRELVAILHRRLCATLPPERVREVEGYVRRYVQASIASFYNPEVYRDAGLERPLELREELLAHPARRRHHRRVLRRVVPFFERKLGFQQPLIDDEQH